VEERERTVQMWGGRLSRRLWAVALPLALAFGALLALAALSMAILHASRAYVAGESAWSKAQKDAISHLHRYARSGDENEYARYLASIRVPLGDRIAREALERPQPDFEVARAGFLQGRNHPDDVPAMMNLFVYFRHVSYLDHAIGIWAEADGLIEQLDATAQALRTEVQAQPRDEARVRRIVLAVEALDARLRPLEDAFSDTLGEASRWLQGLMVKVRVVAGLAFALCVMFLINRELRRAEHAEGALRESEMEMKFLAQHDTLTGLPNRAMFQEQAQQLIAQAARHDRRAALLFIDLDNFKQVNDTLGHGTGDALLKAAASRLRLATREEDLVARLGGDEFCVLLSEVTGPADAAAVAQKLLAALVDNFRIGERELYATASIGIGCFPEDGADANTLLMHADVAMYRAKDQGKNGYQFFSADMNRDAGSVLALIPALRGARERGELRIHYQPRFDMKSGRPTGMEALLRWQHPERGLLPPSEFIPIAEDTGLIVPIGEWILREACAQARRWMDAGLSPMTVGVNLSMRQLRHPGLVAQVRSALETSGLPAACLELEITESMAMRSPDMIQKTLLELADLGLRLSLDDFGTGYSSLNHLKRFPIHALKIDKSFVDGLPTDEHDAAITRAIIAVAKSLNLDIVAEGVESTAQRDFLVATGCRQCQGYLYGKPSPADEFERRFLALTAPA
jgi:diguanylate cyclase (GGDEF)-like protein